ncbi:MAG: hypothetical protein Q9Q40_13940 [Acidobacteriota bacterium]|nr:hypothetical protein [Acidobacteriota bacterium]MDQ7086932.1 hypothetical protein [Acidobacteriota bacterium]
MRALLRAWRRRRRQARLHRCAHRELDRLFFERRQVLAAGRLEPRHRSRITLLEVEAGASGEVRRILFGIIRHPRPHPLAPRGDEVLEVLEYLPGRGRLSVAGSRNLTRRGKP